MELTSLKFISQKRAEQFNKMGIYSVEGLIRHFPRDYCDLTHWRLLSSAYHNEMILTPCEVLNVDYNRYSKRPMVKAMCQQGGYIFSAVWFNQPYVAAKLKPGKYFFYGRVSNRYGLGASMVNPSFEEVDNNVTLKGILPVYALSGTLTQKVVRNAIYQALDKSKIVSVIPKQLINKYQLMHLNEAYYKIHMPRNMEDVSQAAKRIALEEYFILISAFNIIKGDKSEARLNFYSVTWAQVEEFISRFPFEFTNGQKEAVEAIFNNLHSPHKMNRLIQGDVGSGKTAVALTGIFMALKSGYQAAMLAPTEVLARQNFAIMERYLPEYNIAYLSGSTPAAQKRAIKKGLKEGTIHAVCGTHAVIQGDVEFASLAFTVCDEQHRFGVAQRSALTDKGVGSDVLIMSATPIPRTLSLIFYGDLDVTTIKDKPKARQEISTSIIPESKYTSMYKYIASEAREGRQTYFVCPKIEGDDEGTVMSVTELYEELKVKMPTCRIALLHGKMKDKQKDDIMSAFKAKEYDCLVSTTVIEVGVDVPDATIMVIYNAERFGLSQLHQLRGRVGRGSTKSYCFLLAGDASEESLERLQVIRQNTDGFAIAEMDLKMRGGGDFMGTRQSGRILSEIKNLKFPTSTIFTAKKLADETFSGGYDLEELTAVAIKRYDSLKDVVLN